MNVAYKFCNYYYKYNVKIAQFPTCISTILKNYKREISY